MWENGINYVYFDTARMNTGLSCLIVRRKHVGKLSRIWYRKWPCKLTSWVEFPTYGSQPKVHKKVENKRLEQWGKETQDVRWRMHRMRTFPYPNKMCVKINNWHPWLWNPLFEQPLLNTLLSTHGSHIQASFWNNLQIFNTDNLWKKACPYHVPMRA